MAQLGLALVGAGIGAQFGQAGLGFAAGSLLGAFLFADSPPDGPRVDDARVQKATYGTPIPIGYGTPRTAGIIIWATELKETRHKQSAKGGPTQVSYTYSISLDILLSAREAQDIIRIYCDKKLQYDVRGTAPDPELQTNRNMNFRFYSGSAAQERDPLVESIEGTDNTPAYRGYCHVVIEDFQLADFGNRIPSFEFELAYAKSVQYPEKEITLSLATSSFPLSGGLAIDPLQPFVYPMGPDRMAKASTITDQEISSTIFPSSSFSYNGEGKFCIDFLSRAWVQLGSNNNSPIYVYDTDSWSQVYTVVNFSSFASGGLVNGQKMKAVRINSVAPKYKDMVLSVSRVVSSTEVHFISQKVKSLNSDTQLMYHGSINLEDIPYDAQVDKDGGVWVLAPGYSGTGGLLKEVFFSLSANSDFSTYPGSDMIVNGNYIDYDLTGTITHAIYMTYFRDDHSLIIAGWSGSTNLVKFDIESKSIVASLALTYGASNNAQFDVPPPDGKIVLGNNQGGQLIDLSSFEVLEEYQWSAWASAGERGIVWHPHSASIYVNDHTSFGVENKFRRYFLSRLTGEGESLSDVITDLSERTKKLEASDIDVTDLTSDTVLSYNIARQMNAKSAIEPLRMAYFFDVVESDWKVKFVKRGGSSAGTISYKDLGVNDRVQKKERFIHDNEIPQKLNVIFIDNANNQEPNAAYTQRSTDAVQSRLNTTVQIAVGFTMDQAKQIAEKLLYTLWEERNLLEITSLPKHLLFDPTDVITINYSTVDFEVRLTDATYGKSSAIMLECIAYDADTFVSTITGYDGDGILEQSVDSPLPTDLILIDSTLLRDNDNMQSQAAPFYMATLAFDDDYWNGAVVFKSSDDSYYEELITATEMPSWGVALNKLTSDDNWATWDRLRYLDVRMYNGTPSTMTELNVLNGANAALLESESGWEVIQFANVTSLGGNDYRLDTLLRGRRGSDAFREDHAIGNKVILLSTSTILKYAPPTSDIDTLRYYKAISIGRVFESEGSEPFTLEGNSLKPYSPTDIRATRDVSNNLTVTWERRTRVSGQWKDGIGTVPLAEASEEYEVDFLDSPGGTVLRSKTGLTVESVTYSSSEQSADGLTPGDPVTLVIYQISEVVGRGFEAEDTV